MIEITSLQRSEISDGRLFAFSVDGPEPGRQPYPYSIDVYGYILPKTGAISRISVVGHGRTLQESEVWMSRPDVVQHLQSAPKITPDLLTAAASSGFHLSVSLLGVPSIFTLQILAHYEDGGTRLLASIEGQRERLAPQFKPSLPPVISVHLGRSGSTWLMHLLAQHPDILVHQRYPFESIIAKHALRVAEVMAGPHSPPRQQHLEALNKGFAMGPLPMFCLHEDPETQRWLRTEYVHRWVNFTLESMDAFHLALASRQNLSPKYFAEKAFATPSVLGMYQELYPNLRSLFLVRDFRDICCSRYSFSQEVTLEKKHRAREDVITVMAGQSADLLEAWRQLGPGTHLIKYEEMVADPNRILGGVFKYLGLDHSPAVIAQILERAAPETQRMSRHQTSGGPQQSLQRWRRDLTPEQVALANELGAPMLREFGYPI